MPTRRLLRALLLSATLINAAMVAADSGTGAAGDTRTRSTADRDATRQETPAALAGTGQRSADPMATDAGTDEAAGSNADTGRADEAVDDSTATADRRQAAAAADPASNRTDPGIDASFLDASIGQDSDWEPTPFSASYEARYDGVPFTATGTRTLEIDADGVLHFSSRVHTWLVKLDEAATMQLSDAGYLRPLDYAYRVRGLASRSRSLEFDWDAGMVHRTGDRARSAPLEAPAYDPVSWQLALQRDLARGARTPGTVLRYPIADGGEVKVYEIIVRGPQQIELATGTEQTVFLERLHEGEEERSTRVWLAPERDWLLVKLEVVDDDGRMLQLSLKP